MPNELIYTASTSTDFFDERSGVGESTGIIRVGKVSTDSVRSAVRFTNVTVAKNASINRAGLVMRGSFIDNGDLKFTIRGMDADDVSTFNSGNPYGIYSKTTATVTRNEGSPSSGLDVDITGVVNEIITRSGWSSGNDIGFFLENNGSSDDTRYTDSYGAGDDIWLSIRVNNPDLSPTPITVAAPTFPDTYDYGLKIAKPGFDVKIATEAQLQFTTRKNYLKILAEGQVDTTAGVVYQIAHGLGYAPQAIGFARVNGYSFQLPRIIGPSGDPVGSSLRGELRVNSTHIRLFTSINASVYYYLFLDPLST